MTKLVRELVQSQGGRASFDFCVFDGVRQSEEVNVSREHWFGGAGSLFLLSSSTRTSVSSGMQLIDQKYVPQRM